MDIEKYIEIIVENGKIEDMEELSDMLEDTMEIIKEYDKDCYEKYEMKLYEMAYGKKLNKEMAEQIVHKMRPNGERWSYNEIKRLQEERGIMDVSTPDLYITMNMAYNDYQNLFGEETESYVRFSLDFIQDEDAKPEKIYLYFKEIPL